MLKEPDLISLKSVKVQGKAQAILELARVDNVLSHASQRERARMRALQNPIGGLCLTVAPIHTAMKLSDAQWTVMVRFRLGLQISLLGQQCGHVSKSTRKVCNVGLDVLGDHACICDDGGWVAARHNMVRELGNSGWICCAA